MSLARWRNYKEKRYHLISKHASDEQEPIARKTLDKAFEIKVDDIEADWNIFSGIASLVTKHFPSHRRIKEQC